jgi:PKD repeat protein
MTISASANPASGPATLTVFFSANASGVKPPYTYEWSFGEGNSSTLQKPVHNYTQAGNYTAKVTAYAIFPPRNASTTLSIKVMPRPPGGQNLSAVRVTPSNATVPAGGSRQFTAVALDETDREILTGVAWTWSLSPAGLGSVAPTSGSSATNFTAGAAAGEGNLTVEAKQGARTVTVSVPVKVVVPPPPGQPPTIKISSPATGATVKDVVTMKVAASSNTVKVVFRVDGAEKATILIAPFDWTWDTRLHSDGSHVVRAVAYNSTNGSAFDEITAKLANGGTTDTLQGTPPWFFTLLIVFMFAVVFTGVFVAYTRYRRRRMREERQRQREFMRQGPSG